MGMAVALPSLSSFLLQGCPVTLRPTGVDGSRGRMMALSGNEARARDPVVTTRQAKVALRPGLPPQARFPHVCIWDPLNDSLLLIVRMWESQF